MVNKSILLDHICRRLICVEFNISRFMFVIAIERNTFDAIKTARFKTAQCAI